MNARRGGIVGHLSLATLLAHKASLWVAGRHGLRHLGDAGMQNECFGGMVFVLKRLAPPPPQCSHGFHGLCTKDGHPLRLSLSLFFFFGFFAFSRATPMEYGDCQARGLIRAVASSLHHSYSNMGSEPRLRPTPQLMATPDT